VLSVGCSIDSLRKIPGLDTADHSTSSKELK